MSRADRCVCVVSVDSCTSYAPSARPVAPHACARVHGVEAVLHSVDKQAYACGDASDRRLTPPLAWSVFVCRSTCPCRPTRLCSVPRQQLSRHSCAAPTRVNFAHRLEMSTRRRTRRAEEATDTPDNGARADADAATSADAPAADSAAAAAASPLASNGASERAPAAGAASLGAKKQKRRAGDNDEVKAPADQEEDEQDEEDAPAESQPSSTRRNSRRTPTGASPAASAASASGRSSRSSRAPSHPQPAAAASSLSSSSSSSAARPRSQRQQRAPARIDDSPASDDDAESPLDALDPDALPSLQSSALDIASRHRWGLPALKKSKCIAAQAPTDPRADEELIALGEFQIIQPKSSKSRPTKRKAAGGRRRDTAASSSSSSSSSSGIPPTASSDPAWLAAGRTFARRSGFDTCSVDEWVGRGETLDSAYLLRPSIGEVLVPMDGDELMEALSEVPFH